LGGRLLMLKALPRHQRLKPAVAPADYNQW
jgi:hypothetical protein